MGKTDRIEYAWCTGAVSSRTTSRTVRPGASLTSRTGGCAPASHSTFRRSLNQVGQPGASESSSKMRSGGAVELRRIS